MSYIKKTLMANEKLLFHARLHWVIFTSALIWLIISILIFTYCRGWDFFNTILFDKPVYIWLGLIALLISLLHGLFSYIRYLTSEYAVTDKRILVKTGLVQRHALEIFLNKIESVHVSQTVIGRILNYGSIIISGAGGKKEPLHYVPKPMKFREIIHEQISR